ncbi:MAG: DUF6266 family protein [Odoribacter splanchnicus]
MAIYRSAIFNELRKKLANTVMYKLESQGIMRSAPGKIKNPRTPEQLTQRAKISLLGDLGRRFAPIIKEGFRERPKMNSVFNAFVSANVPFVTVDDEYQASVDFTEILCSNGGLDLPDVTAAFTDNTITVAQTAQDNTGTGVKDDVIYAGFYESAVKSARLIKICNRGESLSDEFPLPKKWAKENVHIYAFAVSKSKKHTSSTLTSNCHEPHDEFTTGALSTLIFSSSWVSTTGNILVRQLVSLTGGILSTVLIAWLKHRWKDKGHRN